MSDILGEVMSEEEGNQFSGNLAEEQPADAPPASDFKIEIKKFVLQALLEKAQSVVPSKDTLPVLKNFFFEVGPNYLRVVATDLELMMVSTTEMVTVRQSGSAVFPAKKILEIAREADDGDAIITVVGGDAEVQIGKASWKLKLQSGAEFPPTHDIHDVELHQTDRIKFLGGIHSVRYAAAKDATRPPLMMIDVTDGKMTACDGVRFQQAVLGEDFPLSLKIPVGAIDDLVKLLRTTDLQNIGIGESEYFLVFKVGADVFIANKLMAQFPDVEELLLRPALANKYELLVDRQEFVDAIKRVRINADPETSAIALSLTPGRLEVHAADKFGNLAQEAVDVSWTSGDRQLVVNHTFLLEMLSMYSAPSCSFWIGEDTKSKKSPLMLKDATEGTTGVLQQMMSDFVGY